MSIGQIKHEGDLRRWMQRELATPGIMPPSTDPVIVSGSGTWVWPGANKFSNKLVVTHGLGTIPQRIVITPTGVGGAALTYSAFSKTSATFECWAGDWFETPVAGQQFTFDWVAIG